MCRFNSGVGSPWHFGPVIRSSDPGVCAVLLQTRAPRQVQVLLESRVRHTVRVRAIAILTSAPSRPDVTFFCDLDYDPFLYMQDHEKVYGEHFDRRILRFRGLILVVGFTIALPEYPATIETLWDTVRGRNNPCLWGRLGHLIIS